MYRSPEYQIDKRWKNLRFTSNGKERLEEVEGSPLDSIVYKRDRDTVPKTGLELLYEKFKYLNEYGGDYDNGQPCYRVTLSADFAMYSFALYWERLNSEGEATSGFPGGLIFHGGSNDPLCVSLTPQLWGIHT